MRAENIKLGIVSMHRVPFGRTNRYFLKTNGVTVRISGDLYKKMKIMLFPSLAPKTTNKGDTNDNN